jgi:hypothetical protein
MKVLPHGDFVVADLEYTAWEGALARGWSAPGDFREIVQIGAVRVARAGVSLPEALNSFAAFADGLPILTHGGDDRLVVGECAEKSLANPLAACDWRDIRPAIETITGQAMMSSDLPARFGLPDQGRAHDALADSRALVRVLAHLEEASVSLG